MKRCSVGLWFRWGMLPILVLVLAGIGPPVMAQAPSVPPPNQTPAQSFQPQQLDDLVAPIALYPDPLLGQVLVACTYPVELVEAQQWLQANNNLQGQQLTDAARQQNWDASVQALVAMPDVLAKLTQDIRWTTDLGNAFLAQQADVMSAVQRMRARAQANGKLQSTPQETVTSENQGGQSAIVIQPADPQIIYVPTYDPNYVWGPPDWGYYPPLYYPSYGYGFGPGIDIGFCFGGWGGWGYGGWGWGWGPNWFGRSVFVNNSFFNRYGYNRGFGFGGGRQGRTAWAHDPGHRLGVAYSNRQLSGRFGAASQASRMAAGQSGNWHRFGEGNIGGNSFRGTAPQAGARNSQAPAGSGWQRFQGRQGNPAPAQRNQAPAQRNQASVQRNQASAQRNQAPVQRNQAPMQRNQAPMQRYQAPAQQYQGSAQRYQAPAQRYQAPMQRNQAPAQSYQAPAQRFQSAPRMSAPNYGGGGAGSRSFSGGGGGGSFGGGGSRSFSGGGGGGAAHSSGGGGGGGGGSHGGGGRR